MKQLIIDCNYLCHRARYSTGELKSKDIDTGVIFGFFLQILNIAEIFQSNNFYFVWDSKKSYRKKIFPEYKKKRYSKQLTEQEWKELKSAFKQMDLLRIDILPKLGFKNNFAMAGLEGDDLIAQLCIQYGRQDNKIIMIASDHDLYQLLSNNISMFSNNNLYTLKHFEKEWGIRPIQWKKVKAIGGCNSDGVIGIPKIGEKTVCKYLKGELKQTTKAYQAIIDSNNKELIQKNHKLVDLPFPKTKPLTIQKNELNIRQFKRLCMKYKFRSFLKERWDEWERLFNTDYRRRYT